MSKSVCCRNNRQQLGRKRGGDRGSQLDDRSCLQYLRGREPRYDWALQQYLRALNGRGLDELWRFRVVRRCRGGILVAGLLHDVHGLGSSDRLVASTNLHSRSLAVRGQARHGVRRSHCHPTRFVERVLRFSPRTISVVRINNHMLLSNLFGVFDVRSLRFLAERFPLRTQLLAQLRVVHARIFLRKLFPSFLRPDHEGVHRSLDVIWRPRHDCHWRRSFRLRMLQSNKKQVERTRVRNFTDSCSRSQLSGNKSRVLIT